MWSLAKQQDWTTQDLYTSGSGFFTALNDWVVPVAGRYHVALRLGSATHGLAAGGGTYTLRLTIAGQVYMPALSRVIDASTPRAVLWLPEFEAAAGDTVKVELHSPLSGDTGVDLTAQVWGHYPYWAGIYPRIDWAGLRTSWEVVWFRGAARVVQADITSPTLRVIGQALNATDTTYLVGSSGTGQALTWDDSDQQLRYLADDAEHAPRASWLAIAEAVIDGQTRQYVVQGGRDI